MVWFPVELAVHVHGLALRRWSMADAAPLLAAIELSLPELREWMPWASVQPTLDSVCAFLERSGSEAGSQVEMGFGLFEADGEVVGGFGLHRRRGPGILEIGYWVRSDRTGRGYATAAARALTDSGFDCFAEVERMEIRCHPGNLASAAVPPKLGYRLDGTEPGGHLIWAMARADWQTTRQPPTLPLPSGPS